VNWEAISAIGQIVGALAVVISLIYLANGVRSSARATRVASERSLVEMLNRVVQQLAEHPHLSELCYRGIHDFESLEGPERMRFSAIMDQLFRLYEETYYGRSEGHVAERIWHQAEAPLRDFSGYPGVQAWWRSRSHWFSEDFANLVNELQGTAKAPRLYGEPMGDEG
jgi:hypothetical protein